VASSTAAYFERSEEIEVRHSACRFASLADEC
jgi:hypothetical protein